MNIFKLLISAALLALLGSGCKKFVEIDPPKYQPVTQSVFQNDETAIAAQTGLYGAMVDNNSMLYRIPLMTGIAGDELTNYFNTNLQVYNNMQRAIDAPANIVWQLGYNFIFQANSIYEGCDASGSMTVPVKKQLMAESIFIRAYWHFYLLNLYGDIPLITTTDYKTNADAFRLPKEQVYKQIIEDFKYAELNLNENYVAANSTSTSPERVRPNKATASAFLARVYLYSGKYAEAESTASNLIDNKAKYELETIDKAFLKGSREAIWQLMKPTPTNNMNTWEGSKFILTTKPANSVNNGTSISSQLLNSFEDGDLRKTNWIGKYTDKTVNPNVDYYFPYKYKVQVSADVTEHSILLRLAEQYLIRAEARAQQDNLTGAIDDLDAIRERAGLLLIKDTNPRISKDDLLNAVLKERQTELFMESGHRWMDLKRTGKIDNIMNIVAPLKNTTWDSRQQLWPIPQQSLDNGINLVQNPGYN